MIGDGVNDVIALKQANVAVAMQGGSQAPRSVGDLILMKDTFAPLPFAFREGQRIINGMNDILRIFMVRIFFKAAMIAIVMTIGGFPFAPRQSALLSFFGATVPAIAFALWAQPGPTPKVGLFKLLARFVLPTVVFMTAIGTGVYLAWSIPAKNDYLAAHPGATQEQLIANAYPQAMTALTIFACFAAIFLILLIVPPTKWWAGGAPVVRNDWRMVGVVGFLFACMVAVLAVPLGRTLFEITALPWWQYFVLLGLAFAWSQLCLLVWKSHLLDRWLGSAEDPGNVCAKAAAKAAAEAGSARRARSHRLRRHLADGPATVVWRSEPHAVPLAVPRRCLPFRAAGHVPALSGVAASCADAARDSTVLSTAPPAVLQRKALSCRPCRRHAPAAVALALGGRGREGRELDEPGRRTDRRERALPAGRPPGVTDAAAVPHEVHVHGVDLLRRPVRRAR